MGPVCQWHTLRTGQRAWQPHPGHRSIETFIYNLGGMAEWLKGPVLKTGVLLRVPGFEFQFLRIYNCVSGHEERVKKWSVRNAEAQ